MDGTTAIKIDYYEELKAKADKHDEEKHLIEIAQAFLKAEENGLFEFGVKDIIEWYRENL